MLRGMTAFLEAVDERAGQLARQQAVGEEATSLEVEMEKSEEKEEGNEGRSTNGMYAAGDDPAPHALGSQVSLPPFPAQPTETHGSKNNGGMAPSKKSTAAAVSPEDEGGFLQGKWNHVEEGATAAAAALMIQRDLESSLLRRKDEEIDVLAQQVRRQQATAEAARQELLQRSLQVHQLEESLRAVRARFDEHKSKSRRLLEDKQREYEELCRRVEQQERRKHAPGSAEMDNYQNSKDVAARQREEELAGTIASLRREQERLEAQIAAGRREVDAAHEQRIAVAQQLEFMQLDLRGAQEALESEVTAHQRSKALLQGRQRELNELRAAVEKNGGSFTAAGALISFRGDDAGSRDNLLLSRQLLEKQNALEAAMRDAAEWRRRCERATLRLEEERTTRVNITNSQQLTRDAADFRPISFRRLTSTGRLTMLVVDLIATVDNIAIRFGRLLRRQPVLRLIAAFYMLFLHVWFLMALMVFGRSADISILNNKTP
ncbi:hypothetical protein, conserved [Trypanosoma cruzi]|uniref:Golgin-84 n=1 Tax=Trypanosoma cruzi (strain CL Brener) TaxID=353153 RepID=Q4E1R3_TRYCC|nr:hypothetical protein, conserved [Trypanosoma cruzi]EAN98739.1 hypothetical protein, conserved [Trypanosoma cruzi]|eukprot:XP_820590.1 hypothetical protein [Trypanosoma cruzi strain CL Brener]